MNTQELKEVYDGIKIGDDLPARYHLLGEVAGELKTMLKESEAGEISIGGCLEKLEALTAIAKDFTDRFIKATS